MLESFDRVVARAATRSTEKYLQAAQQVEIRRPSVDRVSEAARTRELFNLSEQQLLALKVSGAQNTLNQSDEMALREWFWQWVMFELPPQPLVVGADTTVGCEQEVKQPPHRLSGVELSLEQQTLSRILCRPVVQVDVAIESVSSGALRDRGDPSRR
jgi:hypothetical protein